MDNSGQALVGSFVTTLKDLASHPQKQWPLINEAVQKKVCVCVGAIFITLHITTERREVHEFRAPPVYQLPSVHTRVSAEGDGLCRSLARARV